MRLCIENSWVRIRHKKDNSCMIFAPNCNENHKAIIIFWPQCHGDIIGKLLNYFSEKCVVSIKAILDMCSLFYNGFQTMSWDWRTFR